MSLNKPLRVLSLFDGMSCGIVALERAGIPVDKYYASEIDKHAIKITQKNFPDTTQLGDVTKWREWDIDWASIDQVNAGFPCQSWSVSGNQKGDKDPRGMLFWVTLDIISKVLSCNPNAKFIMENVKMKEEFEDYITLHTEIALGKVNKYLINSALVSAQNRKRFYWTNIDGVTQPSDKGIFLKDIVEDTPKDAVYLSYNTTKRLEGYGVSSINDRDKSKCLTAMDYVKNGKQANYFRVGNLEQILEKHKDSLVFSRDNMCHVGNADIGGSYDYIKRVYSTEGKSPTLTTMGGGHREPKILFNYSSSGRGGGKVEGRFSEAKKSLTLTATGFSNRAVTGVGTNPSDTPTTLKWRKLTPIECERLQTLPDNYSEGVSNSQRYRMIGNGWTVDVIVHILKYGYDVELEDAWNYL